MATMLQGPLSRLQSLPTNRPPVVLLGGLNVVRALGLAGIPVIVATAERDEPGLFSRYCRAHWPLPEFSDGPAVATSLETLASFLATRFRAPVPLFVSNDDALRFVHAYRARLQRSFRMLLNEPFTTEALLDKDRFADFARAAGLPVPRTIAWEGLYAHRGPVLLKPARKSGWEEGEPIARLFDGNKAIVRKSGAAAFSDELIGRCHGGIVFQEYIEGDESELWCFDGVSDEQGRVIASHTGRKHRCFPPLTGDSSYIELADDATLDALGRDVARAAGLKGIFNMDFKRDARTGRFHLLEINARCNLWLYIGARNGINLAKIHYEYLTRGTVPEPRGHGARFRWIDFKLDRAAYQALARDGRLTLARWIRSLAAPKVYSVFAWRDPMPWIGVLLWRVRGRLMRA